MTRSVIVVDYGSGNLLSVQRALEHVGAKVKLSGDPQKIINADRVLFPGVGAFGNAMRTLNHLGLTDALLAYTEKERPFLGVCLGMQMMLDNSEEFGAHNGLGLIAGSVCAIPKTNENGDAHKIPHIGWSKLLNTTYASNPKLLSGLSETRYGYFVHSYFAQLEESRDLVAYTSYNNIPLAAVINRGSLWGCQFHPEKSGADGLRILSNFMAI